jgi:hypothetical protein
MANARLTVNERGIAAVVEEVTRRGGHARVNVIPATLPVALAFGAGLLILDRLGWRFASAIFDRERLITSTK